MTPAEEIHTAAERLRALATAASTDADGNPTWSNWDDYHGEPKPKPCPDCAPPDPS